MRIWMMIALSGCAMAMASPALSRPVACPAGPMNAQITNPPAGWSPVSDTGAFSAARVEGSGANLALICEYGVAGRLTSEPPPGERVCRAQGTGFDCRRPVNTDELGPPVGTVQLTEGDTVDLDAKFGKLPRIGLSGSSKLSSRATDFIFANFSRTRDQPGYDLENGARASPFARRFPLANECPLGGSTSVGVYFPLIDPTTRQTESAPIYACVTSASGKWYLTRLTSISRSNEKTRATLTWWRF